MVAIPWWLFPDICWKWIVTIACGGCANNMTTSLLKTPSSRLFQIPYFYAPISYPCTQVDISMVTTLIRVAMLVCFSKNYQTSCRALKSNQFLFSMSVCRPQSTIRCMDWNLPCLSCTCLQGVSLKRNLMKCTVVHESLFWNTLVDL